MNKEINKNFETHPLTSETDCFPAVSCRLRSCPYSSHSSNHLC